MSVSQYESVTQEVGLIRSRVVFGLIGTVTGAVCVVCGPGSTKRSSVRLSAPSIDSSSGGVRQVCCWAPCEQEISLDSAGSPAAAAPQHGAQRLTRAVPRWQPRDDAEQWLVHNSRCVWWRVTRFRARRRQLDEGAGRQSSRNVVLFHHASLPSDKSQTGRTGGPCYGLGTERYVSRLTAVLSDARAPPHGDDSNYLSQHYASLLHTAPRYSSAAHFTNIRDNRPK